MLFGSAIIFRFGVALLLCLVFNSNNYIAYGIQQIVLPTTIQNHQKLIQHHHQQQSTSTSNSNINSDNNNNNNNNSYNNNEVLTSITSSTSTSTSNQSDNSSGSSNNNNDSSQENGSTQSKASIQDPLLALYSKSTRRIDGRWSKWGSWSPCSRTCGGGVSVQERQCISRAQDSRSNRGRRRRRQHDGNRKSQNQCVGLYKRHQLCNDKPCPSTSLDFRLEQCAAFNNRLFRGVKHIWIPYIEETEECQLTCRPIGQDFYAILNRTVVDGTSCSRPLTIEGIPAATIMRGMCVEGKCRAVGPNGILGLDVTPRFHHQSTTKNLHIGELCSACEDANSKCILMSFIFTQPQMSPGYALIATIPKGACYVNITQLRPTRNHLALRNSDGSYVFNGNWAINKNGVYDAAGTKFYYNRPDNLTLLESITSIGPLMSPIDIMLVYKVPNPGVKYEYKIPSKTNLMSEKIAPPSIDLRRLDHHRPSTLSSQADEAVTLPRHNHRILKNRRKKYSWKISPSRTPCSKSCGGGFQSQIVVCVRESTQIPVHERRCMHSDKPNVLPIRCATQPCPAHWITTWSPCSVTCGQGEQTRLTFECKQEISHKMSIMVNEGACMEPKPPMRKACFIRDCDETGTTVSPDDDEIASNDLNQDNKYQQAFWRTGPWSQCSSTCGNGYRTRSVICHGRIVHADDCPIQQRPNIRERCENLPPCNTDDETTTQIRTNLLTSSSMNHNMTSSSWLYTEWSQNCDDDCGTGNQYRRVACLRNDETCANSLKPEIQRACTSDRHCGGKWYTGPWGRCIEPCSANPIQKREVLCVIHVKGQSRIVNEKTCPIATRPITEKPCEEAHCPSQWYTSDWSACSNPINSNNCENTIQRRDVRCLDANQHDANNCDNESTPPMKRSCEPAHCSNRDLSNLNRAAPGDQPALDGGCIDKIDRCRTAVQARLCQYEYYQTKCCLSCSRAPELPRD